MQARNLSDGFRLSLLIMAAAGFFPVDVRSSGRRVRRAHLLYSAFMVGLFIMALAAQLTYFMVNWRDVDTTISTVAMLGIQLVCALKIYVFWNKNARITGLLDQMNGDSWVKAHPIPQSLIYTIPVGTALLAIMPVLNAFLLFPFFGASDFLKFPIKFWMPGFLTQNIGYYVMLFCETTVTFVAGAAETVMNTIICGFMAHVKAQLVILRENLQSIGKRTDENRRHLGGSRKMAAGNTKKHQNPVDSAKKRRLSHIMVAGSKMAAVNGGKMRNTLNSLKLYYKHTMDLFVQADAGGGGDERRYDVLRRVSCDELQGQFVKCLRHHQTILNFVKEMESIFTWAVFTQFTISAIIICSATLQITMVSTKSIEFYFSIIFAGGMCTELAGYCYFGDSIIEESSLLPEAIYKCDWIASDVAFRRQMLIFMETTRVPITISAGKFFQLSNQTFLNILKSSYSYYAVFKGLRVNGKFDQ